MQEVFVNMGQIRVLQTSGILTTVGLGSCVGVTLHDPVAKVGAMAHVFLAKSRPERDPNALPGKYADTAIPALISQAIAKGARQERLVAKLAGGANLFANLATNNLSIGAQNIEAVIEQLNLFKIPIIGKDVAGNHGRKMRLFIESGIVVVTTAGQESKEI